MVTWGGGGQNPGNRHIIIYVRVHKCEITLANPQSPGLPIDIINPDKPDEKLLSPVKDLTWAILQPSTHCLFFQLFT